MKIGYMNCFAIMIIKILQFHAVWNIFQIFSGNLTRFSFSKDFDVIFDIVHKLPLVIQFSWPTSLVSFPLYWSQYSFWAPNDLHAFLKPFWKKYSNFVEDFFVHNSHVQQMFIVQWLSVKISGMFRRWICHSKDNCKNPNLFQKCHNMTLWNWKLTVLPDFCTLLWSVRLIDLRQQFVSDFNGRNYYASK